ncbi:hypothetical protein TWF696_003185 [Orbilia brochopaga]|uniref:Uncharacterized protein n=1 Tax=Orbilia brochopaga TaxID=3140254 RepID=A0AAV9TXU1_9PEZI
MGIGREAGIQKFGVDVIPKPEIKMGRLRNESKSTPPRASDKQRRGFKTLSVQLQALRNERTSEQKGRPEGVRVHTV